MRIPDPKMYEESLKTHAEAFSAFEELLRTYNEKFNLTAITQHRDVEIKHFLDSLAGEVLFPAGAKVAEVGSGGGFPSVPLMIVRKDLTFTLFESTRKKCGFLETVIEKLKLNGRVFCIRAEDAGRDPLFREAFDVCCARGVARLNTLAEYCMPLVTRGGRFIAYKGEKNETEEAKGALRLLGGGKTETYRYALPEDAGERMLVCVEKKNSTPAKYPRGCGRERSSPLV